MYFILASGYVVGLLTQLTFSIALGCCQIFREYYPGDDDRPTFMRAYHLLLR